MNTAQTLKMNPNSKTDQIKLNLGGFCYTSSITIKRTPFLLSIDWILKEKGWLLVVHYHDSMYLWDKFTEIGTRGTNQLKKH